VRVTGPFQATGRAASRSSSGPYFPWSDIATGFPSLNS
jgi:hypothetical protein